MDGHRVNLPAQIHAPPFLDERERRRRERNAVRLFCLHPLARYGPDTRFKVESAPRRATFAAARRRQTQKHQGGARGFGLLEFSDMLLHECAHVAHGIAG